MGAGGGPSPVWRLPGGGDPPHRSSSSSAPARWGRQAPATSPGARCDGRTRSTGAAQARPRMDRIRRRARASRFGARSAAGAGRVERGAPAPRENPASASDCRPQLRREKAGEKKGPGRGLVRSEPDLRPVVIRMPACLPACLSVWLSPPTPRNMKESDAVRPTCVCAAAAANLYISRGLITGCLARGGTVPCRRRRGPCGCRGAGATCTVQCGGRAEGEGAGQAAWWWIHFVSFNLSARKYASPPPYCRSLCSSGHKLLLPGGRAEQQPAGSSKLAMAGSACNHAHSS